MYRNLSVPWEPMWPQKKIERAEMVAHVFDGFQPYRCRVCGKLHSDYNDSRLLRGSFLPDDEPYVGVPLCDICNSGFDSFVRRRIDSNLPLDVLGVEWLAMRVSRKAGKCS